MRLKEKLKQNVTFFIISLLLFLIITISLNMLYFTNQKLKNIENKLLSFKIENTEIDILLEKLDNIETSISSMQDEISAVQRNSYYTETNCLSQSDLSWELNDIERDLSDIKSMIRRLDCY